MVLFLSNQEKNYEDALGLEPYLPRAIAAGTDVHYHSDVRCTWPCDILADARLRAVEQVSLIKP